MFKELYKSANSNIMPSQKLIEDTIEQIQNPSVKKIRKNNKLFYIPITVVACLAIIFSILVYYNNTRVYKDLGTESSHVLFDDAQLLADTADLILIGEPNNDISNDKIYNPTDGHPYTLRNIKVYRVIKGEALDKNMDIIENARIENDTIIHPSDYSVLQKGKKYIFFLKKVSTHDYYTIMSGNQGKFNIDGSDEKEKEKETEDNQFNQLKKSVLDLYSKEIK